VDSQPLRKLANRTPYSPLSAPLTYDWEAEAGGEAGVTNPALFVALLIVCLGVPIVWVWWLWKERSELAAFLGSAAAFIFSVGLICWAVGASWQTTLLILCGFAFCAAVQTAKLRGYVAIHRAAARRKARKAE
jgi:hypothetical protein